MFGSVVENWAESKSIARDWGKAEGGGRGERSTISLAVLLFISDFLFLFFFFSLLHGKVKA